MVGQFPALSETFVLNQITGLLDRGAQVDVYSVSRRPQPTMHPDVERYDLLRRTTYAAAKVEGGDGRRKVHVLRLMLRALGSTGASASRVRRVLRHGREDAQVALRFAPALNGRPRRYDVIHCHFGPYGQWGAALRNMGLLSGRLVTTFHGYDMNRYVRDSGPDVYRRLFADGDLFMPISHFWRERLIELGCDPDRTVVHRMGVDCDSFTFSEREPPRDGRLRVLTVGRLVEKKGVEYAIRAVARIASRHPGVEHTIIGDGPLHTPLSALVRELGMEDRVRMVGSKQREEVIAAMERSHVLLAPSVTASDGDQEGIPVVLMEAMATGLPVLSTRHTGIPELVEDGVTGFLVEERDVEGLAEKLTRVAEDREAYSRVAVAGRQRVQEEFGIDGLNDRLLDTFQRLAR